MDIDLSAVHFLRPWWLLLWLPGLMLPVLWHRRQDLSRRLRGVIAPHLLPHLLINPQDRRRLRPVHLLGGLLILGGLAAAGPTWQQDRPDFLENLAPLVIALDLSTSMNATDVAPSRLGLAKAKLQALLQRRGGARTAVIAYAGTAHMVMPTSQDPALLDGFVQALSSDLIPEQGRDVQGVIDIAKRLLAPDTPGSLLLVTDGADAGQFPMLAERLRGSGLQVLVLAAGARPSGEGNADADASGAAFDTQLVQQLADAINAPLGSFTLDDDDLDWVELHAQQHFRAAADDGETLYWKDAGYWLCWPLLVIAGLAIRRGWRVHWLAGLVLASAVGYPTASRADGFADALFTADQQGRWAFEQGHYGAAAAHFRDPYWKGLAAYRAAQFDIALASFNKTPTPAGYFYLGNTYVRLSKFFEAVQAYQQALALQADFPQARANLALAQAMLKDREAQQQAEPPSEKPDEVKFDNLAQTGQQIQKAGAPSSDQQWLDNLTTSPALFLKRKFALQSQARPVSP